MSRSKNAGFYSRWDDSDCRHRRRGWATRPSKRRPFEATSQAQIEDRKTLLAQTRAELRFAKAEAGDQSVDGLHPRDER